MIEIRNVRKRYGDATVVDDVSLTISPGGVVGIVGPNGAGKSTLLSIISRLTKADSGSVRIDGLDVTASAGRELARRLSVMRQENHLSASPDGARSRGLRPLPAQPGPCDPRGCRTG
jgi:ABC-type enterochelin transport system, ATPase component